MADPSHRASIDFPGAAPGSAVEHIIGDLLPKPAGGPKLPVLPKPSDMSSRDLTGSPKGDTVTSSEPVRLAGPGSAPVTAERTRSEAAFLEAMPLMLPQKKKPASRKPMNSQRSPSDAANRPGSTAAGEVAPSEQALSSSAAPGSGFQRASVSLLGAGCALGDDQAPPLAHEGNVFSVPRPARPRDMLPALAWHAALPAQVSQICRF